VELVGLTECGCKAEVEAKVFMGESVKLYTSLPSQLSRILANAEVGSNYLAECVRSWRRAGFDVVSLNGADEIDRVVQQGYEVEYQTVFGARPTIDDFLAAIRKSQASVAGIINADVLLAANPEPLQTAADNDSLILFERINIDPESMRPIGQSCFGFDAFIFGTAPLHGIDQGEGFLFGHPWWDYWFPLAYVAAGGSLKLVKSPVLFHLQHQQNWNHEHYVVNGRKTIKCLRRMHALPPDMGVEVRKFAGLEEIPEADLRHFGLRCFEKLRSTAEPIELHEPTSGSSPLANFVASLNDPQIRTLMGELDNAQAHMLAAPDLSALRQIARTVDQQDLRGDEEARRVVYRAASILASRKATLFHFLALNLRWLKAVCPPQIGALASLCNAMQSRAKRWTQS
jgi:hypothetical protein